MARTLVNSVKITPATTTQVGDVVQSMLSEAQFQAERDGTWVLADGRSVSGSKYETITGNANIPDLRGQFLRGKNNGRADGQEDTGGERGLGNQAADKYETHTHYTSSSGVAREIALYATAQAQNTPTTTSSNILTGTGSSGGITAITSSPITGNSSSETAPKNVTVNFFIKID